MRRKLNVEQNTDAWLEARESYKTASEAAIVMGKSPFTSIEKFKLIKAGLKKQFYSAAMKQGHDLEDQVRLWCNAHFKKTFRDEVWVDGNDEYMASLDGIDGDMLVEIKVSDYTYGELKSGKMPEAYYIQVQQQLWCSPATEGYIVAYSPKSDDYAVSSKITEDSTIVNIDAAWKLFEEMPIPKGAVDRSDDGTVMKLFDEYKRLKVQAEAVKEQMDKVKAKLVTESGEHSMFAGDFKLTRKSAPTRVDYKKAATDADVDLEPYQKVGEASYVITIPKNPFA